jgi:phosphatidate phosphatase APP1
MLKRFSPNPVNPGPKSKPSALSDPSNMSSESHILRLLHRASVSAEQALDQARYKASSVTGRGDPRQIVAYRGYADRHAVRVSGRVLSNRPFGGPLDDDGWWDNLANTWRRWESDEVPYAPVRLRLSDQVQHLTADQEGYYHAELQLPAGVLESNRITWLDATASAGGENQEVRATHEVMIPPTSAAFGIISDLDDTVIHTGITSLLLAAKLTFLENARTRKPLDGVAKLYEALHHGHAGHPLNPIFYISSSPWNLHDLLVDFLRLNDIPAGPLLLRDLGLDETKFIKEKGHGHKRRKACDLLASYPDLPFVLIGDSGQEDPAIYADIAAEHPRRIRAIYIRDVDPEHDTNLDAAVHRAREKAHALGVPMILAKDSLAISLHAESLGLIQPGSLSEVVAEIGKDQERPGTGEQAVHDAVDAIVPD